MELKKAYAEQMKGLLGEAGFFAYLSAMEKPYERAMRLNRDCPEEARRLAMAFAEMPVPWAKDAFYVKEDARPGLSPLHEAGLYYLQEPSAMAPVCALDPQPGERVLDLCAAPGGKSTQISALMEDEGLLVANEIVPSRAQILSRNIERMGIRSAVVTNARPEQLAERFEGFFDRILVDAPCSGEGMFRRQPEAMDEWDEDAPARCAARQKEILRQAAKMLRPGGRLVYSTCTFNRTENDEVIAAFCEEFPAFCTEPFPLPGLPAAPAGTLHIFPHEMRGEGHFVACLRKTGERETCENERPGRGSAPALLPDVFAAGCAPRGARQEKELVRLWPEGVGPEDFAGLRVLRAGLHLAEFKGKRAEPDHALAMAMRPEEAARSAELTEAQAAAYQAGEALSLGDLPEGYTLLCLKGKSLGWGKQAGGFMKNHYPKGLRRR